MKDHREIGKEQELFFVHEYAPGAIFWLPKGWVIYQELTKFIREKIKDEGYQEISTPVMVKNELFKKSGHWEHFGENNMFNLAIYEDEEIQGQVNYSLKPMNCPEAALVFSHKPRSYRDLPIRLSEFGILHRRELSGVLGGLLRVRQFTIDDAHLFVRQDQIMEEIHKLLVLVVDFYKSLGFEPKFYLATRPDKAMGDPKVWKIAEKELEDTLKQAGVKYGIKEKDGAFYGPKIDTHIEDSQGRDWQLATIQLDFMIPESLELEYTDAKGEKARPAMIHRGIFGSFERFIGMLMEHFQGAFPTWLAPAQVVVVPISDKFLDYASSVEKKLKEKNIRVEVDRKEKTMQAKVREAEILKVPYILVVGGKEEKARTINVRSLYEGSQKEMPLEDFASAILDEIANRSSQVIQSRRQRGTKEPLS